MQIRSQSTFITFLATSVVAVLFAALCFIATAALLVQPAGAVEPAAPECPASAAADEGDSDMITRNHWKRCMGEGANAATAGGHASMKPIKLINSAVIR